MADEIKRLRPIGALHRVDDRADDAAHRRAVFDDVRQVNRADSFHGFNDRFRKGWSGVRIWLVKIKAMRFPILMQAKIKIKTRLPFQPGDVRAAFLGFWIAIIAIQVNATGVLTLVEGEPDRI